MPALIFCFDDQSRHLFDITPVSQDKEKRMNIFFRGNKPDSFIS